MKTKSRPMKRELCSDLFLECERDDVRKKQRVPSSDKLCGNGTMDAAAGNIKPSVTPSHITCSTNHESEVSANGNMHKLQPMLPGFQQSNTEKQLHKDHVQSTSTLSVGNVFSKAVANVNCSHEQSIDER
ncbi:hypothetical protein Tco_1471140, partial [Tanacetum coccineum]